MLLYVCLCLYVFLMIYDPVTAASARGLCGGQWAMDPMAQWTTGHDVFVSFWSFFKFFMCISISINIKTLCFVLDRHHSKASRARAGPVNKLWNALEPGSG